MFTLLNLKWLNPKNQIEFDYALDHHMLYCAMRNGKWWLARRNGKTQTWKKDANRFRIPIKCGMYSYHAITETDDYSNYRIAESRELAEGKQ